jgi:hypothetical protein
VAELYLRGADCLPAGRGNMSLSDNVGLSRLTPNHRLAVPLLKNLFRGRGW